MCLYKLSSAWTIILILSLVTGQAAAQSLNERKEKIRAMETKVSPDSIQRKSRSEATLRTEGVPINKSLPVIESEKDAKRRTKEEVAYRTLALLVVAVKGEGLEQPIVEKIIKDYELDTHFTPKERVFLKNQSPSQHDRVQFDWRYEAAWTMLWALGYVEKLEKPTSICDVPRAIKFMKDRKAKRLYSARVKRLYFKSKCRML